MINTNQTVYKQVRLCSDDQYFGCDRLANTLSKMSGNCLYKNHNTNMGSYLTYNLFRSIF